MELKKLKLHLLFSKSSRRCQKEAMVTSCLEIKIYFINSKIFLKTTLFITFYASFLVRYFFTRMICSRSTIGTLQYFFFWKVHSYSVRTHKNSLTSLSVSCVKGTCIPQCLTLYDDSEVSVKYISMPWIRVLRKTL